MFEAKHKLSGQICAVKKIDKSKLNVKEKFSEVTKVHVVGSYATHGN